MSGRISYFKGPRSQWKTGLRTYAKLRYANLWRGVDLVYSGSASRLKYTFVVRPGADPGRIRLAYRGASAVRLNRAGQLAVSTPVGGFRDEHPYAYQQIAGRRVEVPAAFSLEPGGGSYGFRVGAYGRSEPLVLDPAMLVYAGYIGGSSDDRGDDIAVDSAGNAYVAGQTGSAAGFPVMVGPDLTYNGSTFDAFVAKVNAAGTGLVYAGYIGGSSDDAARDIAVDASGNAYVSGITSSTAATFPVLVGPDLSYNGGVFDAFVAKVNAAGTALLYAGYIGGPGQDEGHGIAIDIAGNAFGDDGSNGIAVDSAGNALVAGTTTSSEATFPEMVGPDLTYNGAEDGFVAKVNVAGTGSCTPATSAALLATKLSASLSTVPAPPT